MSKLLTQAELDKLMQSRGHSTPSRPQERPSRAADGATPTGTPPEGICLSDRPEMAQGWLNSYEGHKWMINRCEAFSRMDTGGRMNFGFLPKNKEK